MYRFTTEELLAWQKNPHINPITQNRINPFSKKGIAAELSRQWEIYVAFEQNVDKTKQIPVDVVYEIFRKTFQDKKENLYRSLDMIWKQDMMRHSHPFFSVTKTIQQMLENPDESMYRASFLENGFLFVGNFDGFYMKKQHCKFSYYPWLKENTTSFCFAYSHFSHRFSSIYYDDQYCAKYNITRTFWRNMMPKISFDVYFHEKSGHIELNCNLAVKNEFLTSVIPLDELKRDIQDNDAHPLLNAYREAVRVWFHSLHHLIDLFEPCKTSADNMTHLYRSLTIMHKNVFEDVDISTWKVKMKSEFTNNFLTFKFGNDNTLHQKRLQTLVHGPHRKKIFI